MQPNKMLTVKELRAALTRAPDDAPVLILNEDSDVIGVVCAADPEQPLEGDEDPIYRDRGVMLLELNSLDNNESVKSMEGDLFGALKRFIIQ